MTHGPNGKWKMAKGGEHEHGANGLNKQKFPPSPGQLFTLRLGQKKFTE